MYLKPTMPGFRVAVALASWSPECSASSAAAAADADTIPVKFMGRVLSGTYAGVCCCLQTHGTVQASDVEEVHSVGNDGDRALVAYDALGFRMVDGVHFVRKEEEQLNVTTAYPISEEAFDLEFIRHCRRKNKRRKLKNPDNADSCSDSESSGGVYTDSEDSDYKDVGSESDEYSEDDSLQDDDSLNDFIVHSDEEETSADGTHTELFSHPPADTSNPDVAAMRSAASDYHNWAPKDDRERAAKALIDNIEARARHDDDERRFRCGKAALEADR